MFLGSIFDFKPLYNNNSIQTYICLNITLRPTSKVFSSIYISWLSVLNLFTTTTMYYLNLLYIDNR